MTTKLFRVAPVRELAAAVGARRMDWRATVDAYMAACAGLSPEFPVDRSVLLRPRRRSDGRPPTSARSEFFRCIVSSEIETIQIEEGVRRMPAARLLAHHLIDSPSISEAVRDSLNIPKPGATEIQIKAFAGRLRHWLD